MKQLKIFTILCIVCTIINGCCITRPNCNPEGGNFIYGPDISYRSSKFTGSDAQKDETKRIGSIGLGGYIHWIFCEDYPDLGFLSGLYYNQHGVKIDYSSDDQSKLRLSYLTIPLTFTYRVHNGISVEAGPDLSFLLSAKDKNTYNGQTETYDFKDETKNFQFGYNIAVSYMHDQSGLGGFVRWNGGLSKVRTSDSNNKIYNGGFSIGARYRINHLFYKGQ